MKIAFINPFIRAAVDVLTAEVGGEIERGAPRLETAKATADDIAVIIGVTGDAQGIVLYSLSEITAKAVASQMLGQPVPTIDGLAESAIAELGNVIAGAAAVNLEVEGYMCKITPPTMIYGRGTIISMIDIQRLVVPLKCKQGAVEICIAIRDAKR